VAIGLNSVGLSDDESKKAADRISEMTSLPAVDAFRFGPEKLTDALIGYFSQEQKRS
jgi:uncharacterized NAD-dependent epimerase/dehydratase family protein